MRIVAFTIAGLLISLSARAECGGRFLEYGSFLNPPLCVPAEPKRIIALDRTFSLGMALELGVPVAGAPLFGMSDEELKAKAEAAGVTDLGSFMEPSLEKIVALQPVDVLREAGVRRTDFETSKTEVGMKRLDFEGLAGLDGDILLYIVGGSNDSATSGRRSSLMWNEILQRT